MTARGGARVHVPWGLSSSIGTFVAKLPGILGNQAPSRGGGVEGRGSEAHLYRPAKSPPSWPSPAPEIALGFFDGLAFSDFAMEKVFISGLPGRLQASVPRQRKGDALR